MSRKKVSQDTEVAKDEEVVAEEVTTDDTATEEVSTEQVEDKVPSTEEVEVSDTVVPEVKVPEEVTHDHTVVQLVATVTPVSSVLVPTGIIDELFGNEITRELRLLVDEPVTVTLYHNVDRWIKSLRSLEGLGVVVTIL